MKFKLKQVVKEELHSTRMPSKIKKNHKKGRANMLEKRQKSAFNLKFDHTHPIGFNGVTLKKLDKYRTLDKKNFVNKKTTSPSNAFSCSISFKSGSMLKVDN